MASSVYWIHHPEHTDMFTQGYIGVSNDVRKRWLDHKRRIQNLHFKNAVAKYGWDNMVKKEILIAEEAYCLDIENKLRPTKNIGWNIAIGGGKPPITYDHGFPKGMVPWNKGIPISDETRKIISQMKKGTEPWNKGLIGVMPDPWNKGKQTPDEVKAKQSLAKIGKTSPRKGVKLTPETIAKMVASKIGHFTSEATKQKLKDVNLGRKHKKVICPHCNTMGGITGMARWHFDRCKNKENT
jgi:hypothetical protein